MATEDTPLTQEDKDLLLAYGLLLTRGKHIAAEAVKNAGDHPDFQKWCTALAISLRTQELLETESKPK